MSSWFICVVAWTHVHVLDLGRVKPGTGKNLQKELWKGERYGKQLGQNWTMVVGRILDETVKKLEEESWMGKTMDESRNNCNGTWQKGRY